MKLRHPRVFKDAFAFRWGGSVSALAAVVLPVAPPVAVWGAATRGGDIADPVAWIVDASLVVGGLVLIASTAPTFRRAAGL